MPRWSLGIRSLFFLLVFILLSLVIKGGGTNDKIQTILGAATFVYGVFLAFYTVNAQTRLSNIVSAFNLENGTMLFLAHAAGIFGQAAEKRTRAAIDAYIVAQLDFKLYDYYRSEPAFFKLVEVVKRVPARSDVQVAAYQVVLGQLNELLKNRKTVESLVRASLSVFEWLNLGALLLVILSCLFYLNDGTFALGAMTILLSTASVTMLFTLFDLNALRWQEQMRIWDPVQNLFNSLGSLPYYPDNTLLTGRLRPLMGKVRIATYAQPYPSLKGKRTHIVELTPENWQQTVRELA